MIAAPDRWEHGSDFHLVAEHGVPTYPWAKQASALFGSGRAALAALYAFGREQQGWTTVWLPDFYCHEVVPPLEQAGARVRFYQDDPGLDAPRLPSGLATGDVVVVVNYYGLRPVLPVLAGTVTIGDHTHDPFGSAAQRSQTDYAFASLRKTLPLPDGAVLWSPRSRGLPSEPAIAAGQRAAAASRLMAMVLKARYLDGAEVAKEDFRSLAAAAEGGLAVAGIAGISEISRAMLRTFPVSDWQERRLRNHRALRDAAGGPALEAPPGCTPFAYGLLFEEQAERDRVREALIAQRVYPAVLWPIPSAASLARAAGLSGRTLSVHCDFRYGLEDMSRVADILRKALA